MSSLFVLFIIAILARYGTAAFVLPPAPSASNIRSGSRDVYSQQYYFPSDENWGNEGPGYPDGWQSRHGNDQFHDSSRPNNYDSGRRSSWEDRQRNNGAYGGQEEFYDEPPLQQYNEYDDGGFQDRRREEYEPQNYFDQSRRQRPQMQYGANLDQQEQYQDFGQTSFDNGRLDNYYGEPRPPFGGQEYQQQYQDNLGRASRDNEYEGENYLYNSSPSPRQFEDENSFGRMQPQRYDFEGNQETHKFDRKQLQQYRSDRRAAVQRQVEQRRSKIGRNGPIGYEPLEMMMDRRMSPFTRFGIMDQMMNEMMNPFFAGFGMMDQMMDRFSSEMEANMNRDQQSIDGLLADARDCLLADAAVTDVLGDAIELGMPFSRSSSSAIISGVNRSRLQLGIPIRGSRGTGRVRLLADEEGMTRLEVDVEGRTIDVHVGASNRSNFGNGDGDVIDATVVDKEVF